VDLVQLYILIKRFEGCRLTPYLCPSGVWTCGWGSTGVGVFPGQPWTQEYADQRMQEDAQRFALATKRLCPNLEGPALCAAADFAYNCGVGAFKMSTLRRRFLVEDWAGARVEFAKWVRGGGKKLPGLVIRRAAEAALLPNS